MSTQDKDPKKPYSEYSFLKEVYIELPNYKFFHSPSSVDKIDSRFRGRKKIENKLFNILDKSESKSGAYLITGYRGVGKTSLVNKVLSKLSYEKERLGWFLSIVRKFNWVKKRFPCLYYKKDIQEKSDAPVVIKINLGHDDLKEKDILNLIAKSLLKKYEQWNKRKHNLYRKRIISLLFSFFFLLFSFLYGRMKYPQLGWGGNFTAFFKGVDFSNYEIIFFENYKPLIDFCLFMLSLFVLYKIFERLYKRINKNEKAINKLKFLNQRIDSYITNENDVNLKRSNFGFRFSNKISYTIAGSRDIEVALIEIFEDIDIIKEKKELEKQEVHEDQQRKENKKTQFFFNKVESFFYQTSISFKVQKPKFIFVFDELDKIDAHQNITLSEKEGVTSDQSKFSTNTELTRQRQEKIFKILANLKHFFSTARAKFIFIAGREMYDATLADTSDRNYFLGSIFHDVIYVNSFLTEDPEDLHKNDPKEDPEDFSDEELLHRSYYHTMAEEFLCQSLMPSDGFYFKDKKTRAILDNPEIASEGEKRMSISLKTYKLYLEAHSCLREDEQKKVIVILNQFVTYLLHRSSGSPKKLTHLLETYICNDTDVLKKKGEDYQATRYLIARNKGEDCKEEISEKLFLHFDYYSQHTFSFINYLSIPYYYNISRYVKRYNDKLMVSTSYLIDHLYKFHDFGFSWRNLEVTPEIIDINKAPTLRKLIEDIVNFLSYTHLEHVVSGLYDFKFKKKISYEINFLSKVSEREATALNFTLDEAHEVKGHFSKKLEKLYENYKNTSNDSYVHSMGYVQQSLADLYYYDQEYDDASIIYKDAIQFIKKKRKNDKLSLRVVIIFSRIMLKLGLSFERKKAFTSAYMAYAELSNLIMESLEIELSKINKKKVLENDGQVYVYETKPFYKNKTKESEVNYFEDIFKQPLYSETHKMLLTGNLTETVRLLYQPFVAKLHMQDKEKIGGVTKRDIELTLKEISFLTKVTNPIIEKKILSEYYNKIGDFLFFTNRKFEKDHSGKIYNANKMYLEALKLFIQSQNFNLQINDNNIIDFIFKYLTDKNTEKFSFEELKMIASNLSDYGDSLLSEVEIDENPLELHTLRIIQILFGEPNKIIEPELKKLIKIIFMLGGLNKVFCCYALSYYFYFKNDDHSKAAFQSIKILHVLQISRGKSPELNSDEGKDFLVIIRVIVEKTLYSVYRSYSSSTRLEIERMKGIFKIEDLEYSKEPHVLLNNLPSISEVQEILMIYKLFEIELAEDILSEKDNDKKIEEYLSRYNPSIYGDFSGMYSRLNSLHIKIRANSQVFFKVKEYNTYFERPKGFNEKKINTTLQSFWGEIQKDQDHELIQYLIADTIYCSTEIIRILKTFGVTYITNHSTFGYAYETRSKWCEYFDDYDKIERKIGRVTIKKKKIHVIKSYQLYKTVRNLIGSQAMSNLRSKYNREKAISHYVQAIETHEGKFAYSQVTESMYYLDNDFNDNHLHFFAALERYKIKARDIRSKIKTHKEILYTSSIYDVDKYMKND